MLILLSRLVLLLPAAVAVGGCCTVVQSKGRSPLAPAHLPPDSVVLDIFFVRFPFGDEEANGRLWEEIDEQHFPTEVRRRLAGHGFRVGLVGGQVPVTLSRMLELTDKPPPTDGTAETSLRAMESEPAVVSRHLQVRAGRRSEIVASGVYEELPVVMCESGALCGKSYPKAQGLFTLKAFPEPDGRVRLELVPELHYGEPRQRYVPTRGGFRVETGKDRRVFDELAVSARLNPGHMIVMSSLACRPGSLGHHFFTQETAGQQQQKLLVIRLSQTQHDDMFAPVSIPPLAEVED